MQQDAIPAGTLRLRAGSGLLLAAAAAYFACEAVAAAAWHRPLYSYARNYISDLGVPARSDLAWLMNTAFCVQGTLFLVGAVLAAPRTARLFVALAAANAVGNVLIAVFHSGSATHAVGAVSAIVGGNAAILAASRITSGWHRAVSIGLGVFGLLSFVVFVIALKASPSSWLVSTMIPSCNSGIMVICVTIPGRPPV